MLFSLACSTAASGVAACGSRTGLAVPIDVEHDAGFDAPHEADALVRDDAAICPDGGLPTAYLIDAAGALYVFDPASLHVQLLGTPNCGAQATEPGPWTLSVSREGVAYVVYEDWNIYAVDLHTLACTQTPFVPGQLGISNNYAIAISRASGPERMFVFGLPPGDGTKPVLASTDLSTFVLTEVGRPIALPAPEAEFDMQADAFGNLYLYTPDGVLTELGDTTGAVTGWSATGFPPPATSWAVMTYQDQVYLFGGHEAARYDFATRRAVDLGPLTVGSNIVGASAIPCEAQP